jgi:hypothetical protein
MTPHSISFKVGALGILVFAGLTLIALGFVNSNAASEFPTPSQFVTWGLLCLFVAGVWMYWDHKRRVLTPDEEIDKLLLDVAKRYRQTGSLAAVVDEYRTKGASDDTLTMIRAAPGMLRTRADTKVRMGMELLGVGLILTVVAYGLARVIGASHYEVGVGAIGGGVGFIAVGIRQRRAFRVESRKPLPKGNHQ